MTRRTLLAVTVALGLLVVLALVVFVNRPVANEALARSIGAQPATLPDARPTGSDLLQGNHGCQPIN
jgi:hypothetical protein